MTPRKAYRASSCGYTRKICRASYAGCHSQCDIIRWNIGQNLALLASRDDYDRALARDNLRVWKMRLRVAVSNLARSPRPELPGRSQSYGALSYRFRCEPAYGPLALSLSLCLTNDR